MCVCTRPRKCTQARTYRRTHCAHAHAHARGAAAWQVGVLGICLNGFALHGWYRVLDRVFGKQLDSWRVVLSKVLADQAVYAPFACASFLVWASVLQVLAASRRPWRCRRACCAGRRGEAARAGPVPAWPEPACNARTR